MILLKAKSIKYGFNVFVENNLYPFESNLICAILFWHNKMFYITKAQTAILKNGNVHTMDLA